MADVVHKWKLKIGNKRGFKAHIKSLKKKSGKEKMPLEEAFDFDLGLEIIPKFSLHGILFSAFRIK